jgi:hypothetical protein
MKKPSLFTWIDFLTFGLAAILAIAGATAATVFGAMAGAGAPIYIVSWLSALGFVGIYVALLVWRAKALKQSRLTRHGVMYVNEGFGPSLSDFELYTSRAIHMWNSVGNPSKPTGEHLLVDAQGAIVVRLRVAADTKYSSLKGRAYGRHWLVPAGSPRGEAIIHALLHLMYEEWTGNDDIDRAHEWFRRHGLP